MYGVGDNDVTEKHSNGCTKSLKQGITLAPRVYYLISLHALGSLVIVEIVSWQVHANTSYLRGHLHAV